MVGKVGQDSFGQELLSSASASGVDVSRVIRDPEAPSAVGNVQLEVTPAGTANRIIVVSGANMTITPADVAFLEEGIGQFDMVILQLEIPMEINCLVASWAKRKGVPVMLNSDPMRPYRMRCWPAPPISLPTSMRPPCLPACRWIRTRTLRMPCTRYRRWACSTR